MLVILWTDALVFILVGSLVWMLIWMSSKPYLCDQWRKAYSHPTRMIAMVILLCFTVIGFLDCLHYRVKLADSPDAKTDYSIKVHSVLDWLLMPTAEQMETTYSAPFATQLFSKEMVKTADGAIQWVSPKLQYASAVKIWHHLLLGVSDGLTFWLFISALFWFVFIKLYKLHFHEGVPWRTGWLTFGFICILMFVAKNLMVIYHIFGTDKIGTDVFYESIKSIRTGLIIGTLTTFITLPFAILFGAMAGYFRGWVDDLIQYLYITVSSVPGVLLIAASVLTLDVAMQRHQGLFELMAQRTDMRLLILCCVLGLTSWTSLCRILRGETLKLRDQEFVLASRAMGLTNLQIIIKHIIPNLMHIILISIVLDFSGLVLAEAVLSYVGVGVDPSTYSWGNMINSARMEMGRDPIIWWSLCGAFILMFTLVLAANIFADGVRDAFDPKAI
jgi:peptide/nickel transport system permease protein